ncbi:hypothetical protein Tco_0869700, partial [Tanacetum coccineum]
MPMNHELLITGCKARAAPLLPAYVPDPMELEHHAPVYVLEPVYPEYLVLSDDDILVEDPVEDQEGDPIDYVADADDDEDEEEESSKDDDDEEEEHLAPADSTTVASPTVDLVPSIEETEPFETDESTATPLPPPTYRTTSKMSIPSPPLPLLSPPTHNSPTYTEAPLRYRAVGIWLSVASPLPLHAPSTSRRSDIPPRKRLLLTAPTPRFEVGESFTVAARQPGSTVAHRVDYSFVDTVDASIQDSKRRTMASIERDHVALRDEVDTLRRHLSSLCTTHEQERVEARQALDRSETHNRALEARIEVLET